MSRLGCLDRGLPHVWGIGSSSKCALAGSHEADLIFATSSRLDRQLAMPWNQRSPGVEQHQACLNL